MKYVIRSTRFWLLAFPMDARQGVFGWVTSPEQATIFETIKDANVFISNNSIKGLLFVKEINQCLTEIV